MASKNSASSAAALAIPGLAEGKTSQLRSYNRASRLLKGSPYMLNSEHKPIPVVPIFNNDQAVKGRRRGSISSSTSTMCTALPAIQEHKKVEEKREISKNNEPRVGEKRRPDLSIGKYFLSFIHPLRVPEVHQANFSRTEYRSFRSRMSTFISPPARFNGSLSFSLCIYFFF